MTDPTSPTPTSSGSTAADLDALTAEPDDLDGHTLEDLADYVDRGRTPPDPSIDDSPACRRAIAALERLRIASARFLTDDITPDSDDAWIQTVMSRISSEARAGADVLLEETPDGHRILTTEGALRALVRTAADDVPGVLAGRVRITGAFAGSGQAATVALDLVVVYGTVIAPAVTAARTAVLALLQQHTGADRIRVDIAVTDVLPRRAAA